MCVFRLVGNVGGMGGLGGLGRWVNLVCIFLVRFLSVVKCGVWFLVSLCNVFLWWLVGVELSV